MTTLLILKKKPFLKYDKVRECRCTNGVFHIYMLTDLFLLNRTFSKVNRFFGEVHYYRNTMDFCARENYIILTFKGTFFQSYFIISHSQRVERCTMINNPAFLRSLCFEKWYWDESLRPKSLGEFYSHRTQCISF